MSGRGPDALQQELERVRARLEAAVAATAGPGGRAGAGPLPASEADPRSGPSSESESSVDSESSAASAPLASGVDVLARVFALSPFERDLVVLCAGMELDGRFRELLLALHGRAEVDFGVALAVLEEPHWDALASSSPLRHWRLVSLAGEGRLVERPLRLDERILHLCMGLSALDERLTTLVRPERPPGALPVSHDRLAQRVADTWLGLGAEEAPERPLVQLCGRSALARRRVGVSAGARIGRPVFVLDAVDVPATAEERAAFTRLWQREVLLGGPVLLLDVPDDLDPAATRRAVEALEALGTDGGLLLRAPVPLARRTSVRVDVEALPHDEQRGLWSRALGEALGDGEDQVTADELEAVVERFPLDPRGVDAAALQVRQELAGAPVAIDASGAPGATGATSPGRRLWNACRAQARPRMEDLAQRIDSRVGWAQLVLPTGQLETLHAIATQVRHRRRVYGEWGFADRLSSRGLGITALFAGSSGTGKTLAAEVLGNALDLDVYRIDLSAVVSKWIGETEKNLRRIFDAAEEGGAVLLFDEADALFGKRSDVKDSHDRYANIEVSYLLQRMESYAGLAILTTNQKSALDAAFMRRLRFVVDFPFPGPEERARIWDGVFPTSTPTEGLDAGRLAQLNVAGGSIRNIAVHAAFLAAESGGGVGMDHILAAARSEYLKLDKSLSSSETRGWVMGRAT